MTIKNIGSKIISIGGTVLMPDAEMDANKSVTSTPAIQTFARMGLIKIEDSSEAKAAAAFANKTADDDAIKKKAEEEEAAKKKAAEDTARKKAEEAAKKKAAEDTIKNAG